MGLAISIQCGVLLQFPPSTLFNVFHAFGWPSKIDDTEMSPVHGETKTTGWHFQELNMYYTHSVELNKTRIKNKK